MARPKRKIMTAQLPPTPCPPELRQRLLDAAKAQGRSMASMQREAVTLFLQRYVSNAENRNSKADENLDWVKSMNARESPESG